MDAEVQDGWWWLPGRPSDRRFGRFRAVGSESWTLDVYGSLHEPEDAPVAAFGAADEAPTASVIHGHLLQGAPGSRFVTLLNCWQTNSNRTLGGLAHGEQSESWTFQEVAYGGDVVGSDESAVELRVRLSNLLEWSGRQRPGLSWSEAEASVSTSALNLGNARVPEAAIDFVLDHAGTETGTAVTIRHEAMFRVVPDTPMSFKAAMSEFALPLRYLISFLTLGHVDVDALSVRVERLVNDRWPLWFDYRERLQRPLQEQRRPLRHEMLASWTDLGMSVQDLLGGWFDLYERLNRTIVLLIVPDHAPYLFADDHLMTAILAAENYHDVCIGGTALPPEEHDARVNAIVAAAPVEHRAWANDTLRGKNTKGLRRKLTEVIERSSGTGQAVAGATTDFVELALRSRHSAAHPRRSDRDPGTDYLAASYGLRWILRHCLLVELGLDDLRAAQMITSRKRFTDELELIRRWTASA